MVQDGVCHDCGKGSSSILCDTFHLLCPSGGTKGCFSDQTVPFLQLGTFGCSPSISQFFYFFWVIDLLLGFWMGVRPGTPIPGRCPAGRPRRMSRANTWGFRKRADMCLCVTHVTGRDACILLSFHCLIKADPRGKASCKGIEFQEGGFTVDGCWLPCESYKTLPGHQAGFWLWWSHLLGLIDIMQLQILAINKKCSLRNKLFCVETIASFTFSRPIPLVMSYIYVCWCGS